MNNGVSAQAREARHIKRRNQNILLSMALHYALAAAGAGVFSYIYESFSHGVYSIFMTHLFLIPLLCGAVPSFLLALSRKVYVDPTARLLWSALVLTLALGSATQGVVEIYGTTTDYIVMYPVFAAILLVILVARLVLINRKNPAAHAGADGRNSLHDFSAETSHFPPEMV